MDVGEKQAKATIVAALIVARVEVPRVPDAPDQPPDKAAARLSRLTDYIYQLTGDIPAT